MQYERNAKFKLKLTPVVLACQLLCFGLSAHAQTETSDSTGNTAAPTTDSGTVTITGRKAGMGLMVREDAPKARSTINREELSKERPSDNAYQSLSLLPSVNTYNYDATGMFGGGLTMRGFNSTEIGATINGVPINDSGSYSVYPQELIDQEDVCKEFVTQGSTDVDAPHVGATGGNLGIVTCDPEEKQRIRVMQTVGGLSFYKTYARYDSGRFDDNRAKFYISASHAHVDKWKGPGDVSRNHLDIGSRFDIDSSNYITTSILINRQVADNIVDPTLAQLNQYGYYWDYSPTFSGHLPAVAGKPQTETIPSTYYKLSVNPFENVIASATGNFRLNDTTDLKIIPYYWFGYGTGGTQEKLLAESGFLNPATGKLTGVDLNGDGDTLDKVIVAGSSVTRTQRPGITASVTETLDNNTIFAGVWLEQAHHRQTSPIERVDNSGNMPDVWLDSDLIDRPNGTPYQARDWRTISTAWQFFLQDTISLQDDKWRFNIGARDPYIRRDFTNYANEGAGLGTTYEIKQTYSELLPQLGARYQLDKIDQFFASLSKNMQTPPNFAFSAAPGNDVKIINGNQAIMTTPIEPETSWNLDVGYRYQSNAIIAQATAFDVDFRNRLANSYDPATGIGSYNNAGSVHSHGFELEAGNTPINGWSAYVSYGFTKSTIQNDIAPNSAQALPTAGNQFPLTPKYKTGLSVQYETPVWYVRLKDQHTSSQWATLANDQVAPGYNLADFDAGYLFPSSGVFKNPTLRFNVSNVFNSQYRNPASQSVTNATAYPGNPANNVYYYLGAPRLVSVSLQVDF